MKSMTIFQKKIIFSDEAHFHLNGFVNTFSNKFSNLGLSKSSCNPSTTSNCLVGILVRRRDWSLLFWRWGRNCSDCEWDSLQKHDNGVVSARRSHLPHRAWNNRFTAAAISRTNYLKKFWCHWPPRSCNLTPCDFFLWGFVKSRVYANKPATIPELKSASSVRCMISWKE